MSTKKLGGRILILSLIGHSSAIAEDRRVGQGIKAEAMKGEAGDVGDVGTAGAVQVAVQVAGMKPLLSSLFDLANSAGFDGVVLKNPGGALLGEEMQLTQWTQAKMDPEMNWLTSDANVRAMQEFSTSMRMCDKEVISYLGCYQGDKLLEGNNFVMKAEWFKESIYTFVVMGMSIGLDAMHNVMEKFGADVGAKAIKNAERVKAGMQYINPDATTYLENHPHKNDTFVNGHRYGAIVPNNNQACTDFAAASDPKTGWMKTDFKGEVIVFIEQPPEGFTWDDQEDWMDLEIAKYLRMGWSVAYNPSDLVKAGVDLGEMHRGIKAGVAAAIDQE